MKILKRRPVRYFTAGLAALAVLWIGWNIYGALASLPSPERITERTVAESTQIYDRTGEILLYEIHGEEKRTVIPLEEISLNIRQATLVAEDINFYNHFGLDFKGILRAFFVNVKERGIVQGGSTITQQLVKKTLLGDERTFNRKFKEALLALVVEARFSKSQILELYLNQIPYGSNAYGISSASQTFFAKKPNDLTLDEAALLASLPKAPTYYSPHGSHKAELMARRDWVLDRMASEGFVSGEEAENAKKEALTPARPGEFMRAPHFVFYVREYLNNKYGEEFVERGGLKVVTTLDWKLQEEAEKMIREGAERNESLVQANNAALVAIDPRSGEILAMVGSRDYWEDPKPEGCLPGINCKFDPYVNAATSLRQPGSAFKPFVYSTAFKKGYTPETVLFDVPTEFSTLCGPSGVSLVSYPVKCYHPQNYDGKYRGPVTIRQALAQSLNLPSVKLLYLAGIADSMKTAEDLGITTLKSSKDYGLSLVLGGAEVTLLEMTSAFGVFSQGGIRHPHTPVLRVENGRGEILEEKKEITLAALDTEVAHTINDILSDNEARVPIFSPVSSLYFPDREVAAKTGTTQDSRDAWVVGYTPSLAAGVWVGNNDNSPMHRSSLSIMVAGPIWHRFLEFALNRTPPENFPPPAKYAAEKPIFEGSYRSGPQVKIDKISRKLATAYTPPELIEEISFGEVRTILHSVKKDNPLGDPPQNPASDPQYQNWQAGIEAWLSVNALGASTPPVEYDDLHSPENRPEIQILEYPREKIDVRVKAKYALSEITLFINDELYSSKTAPIVSENISFKIREPLQPGKNKIKVTAYDTVGNRTSVEKEIE